MTDVRTAGATHAGLGLYATKLYNPGDTILEELPLFTFQPQTAEQFAIVRSQFVPKSFRGGDEDNDGVSGGNINPFERNHPCLYDLVFELEEDCDSDKFLGMVTAAASYAISIGVDDDDDDDDDDATSSDKVSSCSETTRKKLTQLYKPDFNVSASKISSSTERLEKQIEQKVVSLSKKVILFLKENTLPGTALHKFVQTNEEECIGIMLIWSCNAFQGGHVYDTISRINHSCDFNAVISLTSSSAASSSAEAPLSHQNEKEKQIVKATSLIQPNDEIHISYLGSNTYAGIFLRKALLAADKFFDCQCTRCTIESSSSAGDVASSLPCINCHERIRGRYLEEDAQYDDDDENEICYARPKHLTTNSVSGGEECHKYVCQKCGDNFVLGPTLSATVGKTIQRVTAHLNNSGSDYKEKNDEMIEMTERLIGLSHSVLGAKHYCTNLLVVQSLGQKLSTIHSSMLTIGTGKKRKKKGGEEPKIDMTEIAECIDLLDRAFAFVQGLNLKSHPGHLLGNATVGVSRMLISLGDVKSMKFGASWAEKVYDYFLYGFEGNGMVKVVETLLNAWKRKANDEKETNTQSTKKSKSSS